MATERLTSEILFHDHQAQRRMAALEETPDSYHVEDRAYLNHETWIRPAFDRLGEVSGLSVLDYGCGHGMAGIVLARMGAKVTGFDLSGGYLSEAQRRARANDVSLNLTQVDGERLPFADHSFDRIWGNAVLHHLDLNAALPEIRRVLRPRGIAVFCEPWGGNPFLNWARRYLPYPGKERTPDEQPLTRSQLEVFRKTFPIYHCEGYQLFSMICRITGPGFFGRFLEKTDGVLLKAFPFLQRFCRYMVLTVGVSG